MRKITIQKMGKIAAVSVMSAIVSISFNGCGFFSSSVGEIKAESCNGKGAVTIKDTKNNTIAKGECKEGVKEGLWKYYNAQNSELIQEVNFVGGIRNGITKIGSSTIEYYSNGKKVGEKKRDDDFYLYNEDIKTYSTTIKRWRKYDISLAGYSDYGRERIQKSLEIHEKNKQIEQENYQMQQEANKKYEEAKAQALAIAKQRAESKVKKPTMQEVKKSKNALDTYKAKLQAQVEKELQIELSKIQAPQVKLKQTIAIPQDKEPKLDTYEEILAFVKDRKYTAGEYIKHYGYIIESSQDSDGKNFTSKIEAKPYNKPSKYCYINKDAFQGNGCLEAKSDSITKEAIEKSMFKDKINAILP